VEDEFIHVHSVAVSRHLVGRQVHSGSPCFSIRPDTAGADEIPSSAAALH